MTNTEAFNKAMKIIEEKKISKWFEMKPIEAFLIPERVVWLWVRIDDYYVVKGEYPKSYRTLTKWEKEYYIPFN